jgi:hypothetical protein
MHKRHWAALLLLSAGGLFYFWLYWGLPVLETQVRARAESALARASGRPARVADAQIHPLLLRVVFSKIRVAGRKEESPPLFVCDRAVLDLTPHRLRRTRPWFAFALGQIVLEQPVFRPEEGTGRGTSPSAPVAFRWPLLQVEWRNGRFHAPAGDGRPGVVLKDLDGKILLTPKGASLETAGDLAGRFHLTGHVIRWRTWRAALSADKISLKEFLERAAVRPPGRWDGEASFQGRAAGVWPPRWDEGGDAGVSSFSWQAAARVRRGLWTPAGGAAAVPFQGILEASPGVLKLKELTAPGGVSASGYARGPLNGDALLDFRVTAREVELEALRRHFPESLFFARVPWRGRAAGEALLTGTPSSPRLKASLSLMEPRAGVGVPSAEISFSGERSGFQAEASLLKGRVRLSGRQEGETIAWDVDVRGLDLRELSQANDWGNIGGLLDGRFQLTGSRGRPQAEGRLQARDFEWGAHREETPVSLHFLHRDGRVRARDDEGLFYLDAEKTGDGWSLSRLAFALSDGLTLKAGGEIQGPENRFSLAVTLRNAPLREIPALLKKYPAVGGEFDFDGTLGGTRRAPVFDGDLAVRGLRLQPGSAPSQARASLAWKDRRLIVSAFDLDGKLKGRAEWSRGAWQLSAEAEGLDARLAGDILKSTRPLPGSLSGKLSLAVPPVGPAEGEGRLAWTGGAWNGRPFERAAAQFRLAGGSLALERAELHHAEGSWQGTGVFPLAPGGGPFSLSSQFKRFSLGPLILDGELSLKGRGTRSPWRVEADMDSPSLWVNGVEAGPLHGRLTADGGGIAVEKFQAGGALSGRGRADFKTKTLESSWTVSGMDMARWGPRFSLTHSALLSGVVEGSLRLDGPWDAPRSRFSLRWRDAEWNGTDFGASLEGEGDGGLLRVKTLRGELGGGRLSGRADFNLRGSSSTVDAALEADAVPLTDTLRLLKLKLPLQGVWGGRLSWTGPLKAAVLAGSLSGGETRVGKGLVTRWEGRFTARNREAAIEEFQAKTPEGVWRLKEGSGLFFTGPGEGRLRLVNELRNIHLGPVTFFGGLELAGGWRMDPEPVFEAELRGRPLWANKQVLDGGIASLLWSGRKIVFQPLPFSRQKLSGVVLLEKWPQVRFEHLALAEGDKRRFWMHGEAGPGLWNFDMEAWDLEAESLMALADLDLPVSGLFSARLTGRGSAAAPRVQGEVRGRDGSVAFLPYDRIECEASWNGSVLKVGRLEASRRKGYTARGEGRFPVGPGSSENDLSFHLRLADGDLAVLKDVWPHCRSASGGFQGELKIVPSPDGPRTTGFLVLRDGLVRADRYFREASDLNARLVLDKDRILVENLSGRVGAGRVAVRGSAGIRGLDVTDYDLSLETIGRQGVEIEAPQLAVPPGPLLKRFSLFREALADVSRGEPRVYLKLTGPDGEQRVEGTVFLDQAQFTYPPARREGGRRDTRFKNFLRDTFWDVHFRAGESTWYRNEYVNVQLEGAFHLYGKSGAFLPEARAEAKRGVISYLGQTYQVKRGVFEVVVDTRTAVADRRVVPYLSGEAERTAVVPDPRGVPTPDTILMIVDRAPLGEIQPRFVSRNNPELASDRVAQRALGFSGEQLTPQERDQLLRGGLVQLLGSSASPLIGSLANRSGIDIIRFIYEPDRDDLDSEESIQRQRRLADRLRGTGLSLGMQLGDRIFGAYKFKVDESQSHLFYFRDELELTYHLTGNLHLRASSELDTERILGQPPDRRAVLENQWRFAPPKPRNGKTKDPGKAVP